MPDLGIISIAIENRSVLEINYEGTLRFVEPHCLGKGSKGQFLLRGFQTGGASDSINFGWKLFSVDKIESVRLAPPRAQYNPADVAMKGGIIAALEAPDEG